MFSYSRTCSLLFTTERVRQGDEHGAGNHRMCSLTLERVLFSLLQNACGKEMSMAQAIISSPTLGVAVLDADWKVLQVFFLFYFSSSFNHILAHVGSSRSGSRLESSAGFFLFFFFPPLFFASFTPNLNPKSSILNIVPYTLEADWKVLQVFFFFFFQSAGVFFSFSLPLI